MGYYEGKTKIKRMIVPKNWNNISIETWAAIEGTKDRLKEFKDQKPEDAAERMRLRREQFMLITRCDVEQAKNYSLDDINKIEVLLKTPMPNKLIRRFKLNGTRYKVETRLNRLPNGRIETIVADAKILNANQLISAVSTKAQPERWHQAIFNVCTPYKRVLYFFRKKVEFEAWEVEARIEEFKRLTMGVSNPIAVFFSLLLKAYYESMEDSLNKQMTKMKTEVENTEADLRNVMDG